MALCFTVLVYWRATARRLEAWCSSKGHTSLSGASLNVKQEGHQNSEMWNRAGQTQERRSVVDLDSEHRTRT